MNQKSNKINKIWQGEVVSIKGDKTLVVRIIRVVSHPIYMKKYLTSKKFHVHYTSGLYKVGEMVKFQESKPISHSKHFIVVENKE